jgi:hypothetical protein
MDWDKWPIDWDKFRRLREETIARLRAAEGDREKIEAAISRYLDQGAKCGMSPYILWDYFAISSPGIPGRAGYCDYECEQMTDLFARLSEEKFGRR